MDGDQIAKDLRAAAITASRSALQPESRERADIKGVLTTLKEALTKLGGEAAAVSKLTPATTLTEKLGQSLGALQILFASSNPKDSKPLRLQEEERTIREALRLSKYRDHVVLHTLPAATVDDFRRALL